MDPVDRQIAEYVVTWAPYGWPPADKTFVEFGMTSQRLHERCSDIVAALRPSKGTRTPEQNLVLELAGALRRPHIVRRTTAPTSS